MSRCQTPRRPFAGRSYRSAGPDVPDLRAGIRSQPCRCRRRRRSTISTSPDRTRLSASLLREFARLFMENRLIAIGYYAAAVNVQHRLRQSLPFRPKSLPREEFRRGTKRGRPDDNTYRCVTVARERRLIGM